MIISKSEHVVSIVFQAIDDFNSQNKDKDAIVKDSSTSLIGHDGNLDSLGLVNLIVLVEHYVNKYFGISITIADDRAMSQKNSPFRNIGTLIDYVYILVVEKA